MLSRRWRNTLRWFYPGMRVKRWLLLVLLGLALACLGAATCFWWQIGELVTSVQELQLATSLGVAALAVGAGLTVIGVIRLVLSVARAVSPDTHESLSERVYRHHQLGQGLNVVGIGGGTGLSALLRGLKAHTSNITATVTVADDGGSSGRLRRDLGTLPPGDIRNCLVALADAEPLMGDWLQYRFDGAEPGLEGHSLGNLLISGLTAVSGDFLQAVRATSKVLNIRGRVVPATVDRVTLCAELEDGTVVRGESSIGRATVPIERVFLDPPNPAPLPEALAAIRSAHVIVLGPGSTFTSVVPNLLVPGIAETIAESPAVKVFVCNVMTQPGETVGFTAADHLRVLLRHGPPGIVDYVLLNDERPAADVLARYEAEGATFVEPGTGELASMGLMPIRRPLLAEGGLVRHDPSKLAAAVMELAVEELALA